MKVKKILEIRLADMQIHPAPQKDGYVFSSELDCTVDPRITQITMKRVVKFVEKFVSQFFTVELLEYHKNSGVPIVSFEIEEMTRDLFSISFESPYDKFICKDSAIQDEIKRLIDVLGNAIRNSTYPKEAVK